MAGARILDSETGEETEREVSGIFIFVGAVPHSDAVADVAERSEKGFILTGVDLAPEGGRPPGWTLKRDPFPMETSVPGIFAAGDVRHGVVRRVASAVGQGAVCVSMIHGYLETV